MYDRAIHAATSRAGCQAARVAIAAWRRALPATPERPITFKPPATLDALDHTLADLDKVLGLLQPAWRPRPARSPVPLA